MKPPYDVFERLQGMEDRKKLQHNKSAEEQKLWYNIKQCSRHSPFVNTDMAKFIVACFYWSEDEMLKEIIRSCVFYFSKGDADLIFQWVLKYKNSQSNNISDF